MSCPSTLVLTTFALRFVYISLLCLALLSYIFEFADDQKLDIGSKAAEWYEHIAKEKVNYPGHRGQFSYVLLFLFIFLLHQLSMVAVFFEHFILLCIVLPCYLILVIVDYVLIGNVWVEVGYPASLACIIFAPIAIVAGIAFTVCLYYRGPSTLAAVFVCHDDDNSEEDETSTAYGTNAKQATKMAGKTKTKMVSAAPKKSKTKAKSKGKTG